MMFSAGAFIGGFLGSFIACIICYRYYSEKINGLEAKLIVVQALVNQLYKTEEKS